MHELASRIQMNKKSEDSIRNYKLIKCVAQGTFGEIWEALHRHTNAKYAIKIEKEPRYNQLANENYVYQKLNQTGNNYVPKIYAFSKVKYKSRMVNAMVMDMFGPSLEQLFKYCNYKFSYKTTLMLGELMLTRIEFMHHKNFIHRDIKPDNFVVGDASMGRSNIYIIDLGLAKEFRNPDTFEHIPMRMGKSLTGTARFASLNTHRGFEQGRADDIEGVGYTMVYFLDGRLPWQGLKGDTKSEKYRKIKMKKEELSVHELCKNIPLPILKFILYARHLEFHETPNYSYLKGLLRDAMRENRYRLDLDFDWVKKVKAEGDADIMGRHYKK